MNLLNLLGPKITSVKLAKGQETNARVVRHISGNGPIYIRRLSGDDDDIDDRVDAVDERQDEVSKLYKLQIGNVRFDACSCILFFKP